MGTTRKTQEAEGVHVGLRVPRDLAEQFKAIAEGEERTVSQELRRLMQRRVDEAERAGAAA